MTSKAVVNTASWAVNQICTKKKIYFSDCTVKILLQFDQMTEG